MLIIREAAILLLLISTKLLLASVIYPDFGPTYSHILLPDPTDSGQNNTITVEGESEQQNEYLDQLRKKRMGEAKEVLLKLSEKYDIVQPKDELPNEYFDMSTSNFNIVFNDDHNVGTTPNQSNTDNDDGKDDISESSQDIGNREFAIHYSRSNKDPNSDQHTFHILSQST